MKNLFSIFNFESLKTNLLNIIKRFPVPVIIIIIISFLFFANLHMDITTEDSNNIIKIILSLVVTFFLSLWLFIASESLLLSISKKYIWQLFVLIFWALFYLGFEYNLDNVDNIIFFILSLSWIIWFLYFSPFLKKIFILKNFQNIYYSYFYNVSVVFLTSAILWWVLSILWSIWIAAVFALFDIKYTDSYKLYSDWMIIALSFIAPLFALTIIPEKKTFNKSELIENIFFSFLVKYIATPFIWIYFIILYAYAAKVLINFSEWPKWEVCWLVIWFSIFGYLIYIFSYIFEEKVSFIKIFRSIFPYVVFPQLFMLFYAIYLRINQYDITMNRYFVVVFGIWLAVISIYLIISKQKLLVSIPIILTIFTLIISIWPWWVYSFPESRQLSRLENNLESAGILNNWKIIPLKNYEDIKPELSTDIYSWINYLCSYNSCESIKNLFPEQYAKLEKKHIKDMQERINKDSVIKPSIQSSELGRWEIVSYITEEIKVKFYYDNMENSEFETLNYSLEKGDIFPIDTTWYSKIIRIVSIDNPSDSLDYAKINTDKSILDIYINWNISETLSIMNIEDELTKFYIKNKKINVQKSDLTFEVEWKNWVYLIYFENISINNPLYKWTKGLYNNRYIWGYMLIK